MTVEMHPVIVIIITALVALYVHRATERKY